METRISVEIVANGFIVMLDSGSMSQARSEYTHVFESYDSMFEHIKTTLGPVGPRIDDEAKS